MTAPKLLSLPLELRLQIYGYLTPFHCYITECVGLALCCKQVYNEYKAEIRLQMKSIYDRIDKEWPTISEHPLQITGGKTINNMRRMTVLLPRTMYSLKFRQRLEEEETRGLPACLEPTFFLYFDHIEFRLLDDENYRNLGAMWTMPFKEVWPHVLMVDLKMIFCRTAKDQPSVKAKTMSFQLGNRISPVSAAMQKSAWWGICKDSDYQSSVDDVGKVNLRPKTEDERQKDRVSSAKVMRALAAWSLET